MLRWLGDWRRAIWLKNGFSGARKRRVMSPSGAGCVCARYVRKRVYQRRRIARDAQSLLLSLRNLPTLARRSGDFNERESFDDTCECIKGWDPGVRWLGEWPFLSFPAVYGRCRARTPHGNDRQIIFGRRRRLHANCVFAPKPSAACV